MLLLNGENGNLYLISKTRSLDMPQLLLHHSIRINGSTSVFHHEILKISKLVQPRKECPIRR